MPENKIRKDVKIGARILELEELKKLLPNYNNIFRQIREIKEVAKEYNETARNTDRRRSYDLQREREFNKHFDNIFSILGERGSGKTSVMLTLKYMLIEGYEESENAKARANNTDMFLPVIVPEDMEASSDILGWLIGYLSDIVEKLEQEIKRNESRLSDDRQYYEYIDPCCKKVTSVLGEKYRELQKAYQIRTAEYKSILKENYVGTNEYVQDRSKATEFDQQLMSKFQEFWGKLVDVKRALNDGIEPLLFIYFDDVDICTERCYEILNTTMRYLAYPNIVVFISGNYKTFSEVLTINFLKRDNLLGEQMDRSYGYLEGVSPEYRKVNDSAIENRKRLAQDYLLKVLPPALRYYMPTYNDKMKAEFMYTNSKAYSKPDEKGRSGQGHEILYELLVKNFIGDSEEAKTDKNFLIYKYKKKETDPQTGERIEKEYIETLYPFFKIFPDSPRGLINIYYFLYNKLIVKGIKEKWNSNSLNQFLNIIVNSSSMLSKYRKEILRIIDIRDENLEREELLFIDYTYLLSVFENLKAEDEYKNKLNMLIEDFITIFMLAYFFENILNLLYGKRADANGYKVLTKILNSIDENDFIIYPKIDNISLLLRIYELISKQNSVSISILKNKDHFLMKYFELIEQYAVKINDGTHDFFEKMYKVDEEWTNQKLKMIMELGGRQNRALRLEIQNTFEKLKYIGAEKELLRDCRNKVENELGELSDKEDINVKREILEKLKSNLNEEINKELEIYDIDVLEQLYYYATMLYSKRFSNNKSAQAGSADRVKEMRRYIDEINNILSTGKHLKIKATDGIKTEGNASQINDEFKDFKDFKINEYKKWDGLIKRLNPKMFYKELKAKMAGDINFDDEIKKEDDIQDEKRIEKEKARQNGTILTIEEEVDIERKIGNLLEIEDKLEDVIDVYEKTFDELKQIMGTMDIAIANSVEFENLLEKIFNLGSEEIGRIVNTIRDRLDKDRKIYKKELDNYLDIINRYFEIEQSQNIDISKKEKKSQLDNYLKSIKTLTITYQSSDEYNKLYYEVAKEKFVNQVLLNYIRVKTLLEINKRNKSQTHTYLRKLKHDLVDYPIINEITPSYFDIYIKYKEKNSLKVDLNV